MKSVLMSINPKWCEIIASGEKTVEVRKTKPKLETPFKVYIYCTKGRGDCLWRWNGIWYDTQDPNHRPNRLDGKVIGEFVCEKMLESFLNNNDGWFVEKGCLTPEEIEKYQGNHAILYGWHISNLVIYDKPKELSEFERSCPDNVRSCAMCRHSGYTPMKCLPLKRPPQSWCYVEGRANDET